MGYRIDALFKQSTVGASLELDSYVVSYHNTLDRGGSSGVLGSFALTYDAPQAGVDFPFSFSVYALTAHTPQASWARQRRFFIGQASSAGLGITIPETIISSSPDITPLLNAQVISYFPDLNYHQKRVESLLASGQSWWDSKGYFPFLIPSGLYSASTCELLSEIQRHLLESTIDGGLTWSLWTSSEVLNYLNERLARFMLETELIETSSTIAVSSGTSDYELPEDLILVHRIAFVPTGGDIEVLTRADKFLLNNSRPGWESSTGTPDVYIEEPGDHRLTLRLVPIPSTSGTIYLDYVPQHSTVTSICSILEIPSMFAPFIKYGVMADMLSKQGESYDPERATYCEERFKEGIELAQMFVGKT